MTEVSSNKIKILKILKIHKKKFKSAKYLYDFVLQCITKRKRSQYKYKMGAKRPKNLVYIKENTNFSLFPNGLIKF